MIKRIVGTTLSLAVLFGSYGVTLADTNLVSVSNKITLTADDYADYSSLVFTSPKGNTLTVEVNGKSLDFVSDNATSFTVKVKNCNYSQTAGSISTLDSSFSLNLDGKVDIGGMYYVDMKYTMDGMAQKLEDIILTTDNSGNLKFVKSRVYDFNVERCSEMWTDEQSLNECLMPQNDIESDHPLVIETAKEICADCETDFEKVYAIYSYILNEFYYDNVQLEDEEYAYQDGAADLIRRKIAICEGFSNVFVALCRAEGIPAVVEFGLGESVEEMFTSRSIATDESPNHAWAACCVEGKWYFMDPTFDNSNSYDGDSYDSGEYHRKPSSYEYFLSPLGYFSMSHKICDADTIHGIEGTGTCGPDSSYEITRDGTIIFSGSGEIKLPYGVNGFSRIEFAEGSNITSIAKECFEDCDIITEVILPDTLKSIGQDAFNTCEDLEYVYLPDGLEEIGKQAFDFCDELSYVYIPDSVTSIGRWAFDDCPRLIISVPEGNRDFGNDYDVKPVLIDVRGDGDDLPAPIGVVRAEH